MITRATCKLLCIALLSVAWVPCFVALAGAAFDTDGAPICTDPDLQYPFSIVADGSQGAIVVWNDSRGPSVDFYAQRVNSAGDVLWSNNGVAVVAQASDQTDGFALPVAAGVVVFWTDFRNLGQDIYAQRLNDQGIRQWATDGVALTVTSSDAESHPLAVSDGALIFNQPSGWDVAWINKNNSHLDYTVRAQHLDANGGDMWTSPSLGGVTVAFNTEEIKNLALTSDGVGPNFATKGAILAWSQLASSGATAYDVYARRVDGSGVVQWGNAVAVSNLTSDQGFNSVAIVNVGSGNVIIGWDDLHTGNRDLVAQKLNGSGAKQWLTDGLPICRASGAQTTLKLISDNAGGVIAVWTDARAANTKIYAQRLDGNGNPLWSVGGLPDGIPICSASGNQSSPVIVGDGAGGAIIAWIDQRTAVADLYAQRVNANGNLLWPATGTPLTLNSAAQDNLCLATDGAGGAIAAWRDMRNGNSDVYINRVTSGGTVDVATVVPPSRRLTFVSANPSRGEVRMRLELPNAEMVSMEVIDAMGRRVRSAGTSALRDAGAHLLSWNGTDDAGNAVAAGVYFVSVRAGDAKLSQRVVKIR